MKWNLAVPWGAASNLDCSKCRKHSCRTRNCNETAAFLFAYLSWEVLMYWFAASCSFWGEVWWIVWNFVGKCLKNWKPREYRSPEKEWQAKYIRTAACLGNRQADIRLDIPDTLKVRLLHRCWTKSNAQNEMSVSVHNFANPKVCMQAIHLRLPVSGGCSTTLSCTL